MTLHPSYPWGTYAGQHLHGEADHDEPRSTYEFDLLNDCPLALEGMWGRLYANQRSQEQ
jgi:hypothetical protein